MSTLAALLSRPGGGLAIALVVLIAGWWLLRTGKSRGGRVYRYAGYAVCGLSALLVIGSIVSIVRVHQVETRYPPIGKRVDVGGYRIHVLAEGEAHGRSTVVWIPGGHGAGLHFHGHHKALRAETRSIIFDRPGTGWSDPGSFPRSTALEAEELSRLLDKAGEQGPFLLVGHSYGGLLAVNYARRNLKKVSGLVLLDPTQPDMMLYLPAKRGNVLGGLVLMGRIGGLLTSFGIKYDPLAVFAKSSPQVAQILERERALIGDENWAILSAQSINPAAHWTSASIYQEFGASRISEAAPDLVVYDGELGDIPVYLVTPPASEQERQQYAEYLTRAAGRDAVERSLRFMDRARLRYLATSTQSRHILAPAKTSHNFPYEQPDFVLSVVRQALKKEESEP